MTYPKLALGFFLATLPSGFLPTVASAQSQIVEYRGKIHCSHPNGNASFEAKARLEDGALTLGAQSPKVPSVTIQRAESRMTTVHLDLNALAKREGYGGLGPQPPASVDVALVNGQVVIRHNAGGIFLCTGALAPMSAVASPAPTTSTAAPVAVPAVAPAATPAPTSVEAAADPKATELERQLAEARARATAEAKAREEADRKARAEAEQLQKLLAEARAREETARAAPQPSPNKESLDLAFWDAIKNSKDPNDYKAYLETYPAGRFAALARTRSLVKPQEPPPQVSAVPAKPAPAPELSINYGRYHALVIGNNTYRNLPKLETAVTDARSVGALLTAAYDYSVKIMENATRADILGALAAYRSALKSTDNLLIYYAGHGYLDKGVDQGYWLPVDAERDSPSNWIANTDLTVAIRGIGAKHVLIVADSCYSGTLLRAGGMPVSRSTPERVEWLKRMTAKKARIVLTSGGVEPVVDGGGGKHSLFAKVFLDVLTENDTVLDGQTLFDRIKRPVVLGSPQTPEYADIRQAGHDGGDFIFVRRR